MEMWHIWTIVAIVFFIVEIFTPGFYLACFGVACLVSGLVSYLGVGGKVQILAFSATTLVVFFKIRPLFLHYLHSAGSDTKTNVDALVGKTGLVSERIDPSSAKGRVVVDGEDWRAVPVDENPIEADTKIEVVKVDGTKLLVKPKQQERRNG